MSTQKIYSRLSKGHPPNTPIEEKTMSMNMEVKTTSKIPHKDDLAIYLIEGERIEERVEWHHEFTELYEPKTALEEYFVDLLVDLAWRAKRVRGFEASLLDWLAYLKAAKDDAYDIFDDNFTADPRALKSLPPDEEKDPNAKVRLKKLVSGRMLEAAFTDGDVLSKLGRYEAHLAKLMKETLKQLHEAIAWREKKATAIKGAEAQPRAV